MVATRSPRTPRSTAKTSSKADTTPRPARSSRQSTRKSLAERSDDSDQDEEEDDDEEIEGKGSLKGDTSPYFSRPKRSSVMASASTPTKRANQSRVNGNGRTIVPARNGISRSGKGKAQPTRRLVKNPEDVTGLTETESDQDSPSEDSGTGEDFAPSDEEEEEEEDDDLEDDGSEDGSGDSDDFDDTPRNKSKKRKIANDKVKKAGNRPGLGSGSAKKGKTSHIKVDGYEEEDEDLQDVELEEGQELAGRIYPAPKTGQVPPGRISQNTLNFLKNLQIPERNDREWFRSHEPAYRQAEKEWKAFVGTVQLKMQEADDELPLLPPKDVIHRIYRDVRFSSDKTPYKRSFSLSTSRSGRKGLWAGYHVSICPNDKSIIACGVWCPAKDELATIRHHILQDSQRLRDVIGQKDFVEMFGPPKPHKEGKRQNVFGHEDALKVAPKLQGVDKAHKDIDLLKLRTVAVVHHWTDEQVLDPDFQEEVRRVMQVMRPLVHLLNDFIALPP